MSMSLTLATQKLKKNTRARLDDQSKSLGVQMPVLNGPVLHKNDDHHNDVIAMSDFLRQMVSSLLTQAAEHGGMTADLEKLQDRIYDLMIEMKKLDVSNETEYRHPTGMANAEDDASVVALNHQAAQLLQTDLDHSLRHVAFR